MLEGGTDAGRIEALALTNKGTVVAAYQVRPVGLRHEWRIACWKRVQLRVVSVIPRVCRLDGCQSSDRP